MSVSSEGSNSSHTGAIVGGVVGGVIVLACIAIGAFFYCRRAKRADHVVSGGDEPVAPGHTISDGDEPKPIRYLDPEDSTQVNEMSGGRLGREHEE